MYRHINCGGFVFPVKQIQINCGLTLTPDGVVIAGIGKISRIGAKTGALKVVCSSCSKEVTSEQIESTCMQCGQILPLTSLYVLRSASGHYCRECCDIFYAGQDRIIASTAMNKTVK